MLDWWERLLMLSPVALGLCFGSFCLWGGAVFWEGSDAGFTLVLILLGCITAYLLYLWVAGVSDVVQRRFESSAVQLAWLLAIVLTGPFGAFLYWYGGRQMGERSEH